mmetsp:Transcript_56792/g.126829  ORF Transcript_56792/g.126829 Transcript_56792/m.126829 type:complete len:248 (+) Transcript_56792:110-853(+)
MRTSRLLSRPISSTEAALAAGCVHLLVAALSIALLEPSVDDHVRRRVRQRRPRALAPRPRVDAQLKVWTFLVIVCGAGLIPLHNPLAVAPELDEPVRRKAIASVVNPMLPFAQPGRTHVGEVVPFVRAVVVRDIATRIASCTRQPVARAALVLQGKHWVAVGLIHVFVWNAVDLEGDRVNVHCIVRWQEERETKPVLRVVHQIDCSILTPVAASLCWIDRVIAPLDPKLSAVSQTVAWALDGRLCQV